VALINKTMNIFRKRHWTDGIYARY